ncbi:MAG: outer membrane lipoprotein-sorting protein [Bacteroidales bacterium]|jgi:hypothetical protein|nr:outer membrane lipoprotein-sorting protein [Bacteroidales bacterium]
MKKLKIVLVALLFVSVQGFGQTAAEISKKSNEMIDVGNSEMTFTLHIRDAKGNDRVRKITMSSKKFGGVTKTLIKFISPADVKGTSLLSYDYENRDDDMWIYMPALKKVRRIVSSEKGKSFMGSEFTNADMGKPNDADFKYSIVETVDYLGKICWKIEAVPVNKEVEKSCGYGKKNSYIEKSTYLCHKAEFYDARGSLQRVQTNLDYRKQSNGKYFCFNMKMENAQTKRVSEMVVDKIQLGSNLTESAFAPAAMEK